MGLLNLTQTGALNRAPTSVGLQSWPAPIQGRPYAGSESRSTCVVDDNSDEDFDDLVGRMADENNAQEVEISEIAEQASIVEVTVPIMGYAHPEVVLFETITEYLKQTPRRPVVAVSISYEVRSHYSPQLIATLFLGGTI